MSEKFGWCFVGAGSIVRRVCADLPKTNGAFVASVCANTFEHAQKFAEACGATAYKTIDEALDDPRVRAVYIAVPHTAHADAAIAAINRGLPVLCEKPFTVTIDDTRRVIAAAREKGVYLAEGMWTRHNPVMKRALEWICDGCIGEVVSMSADFAFASAYDPASRLWDPNRAGGALLDIGVYTVAAADFVFRREPDKIDVSSNITRGVDASCSIMLTYGNACARLFASIEATTPDTAIISGTRGFIVIPKFWSPTRAELHGTRTETFTDERVGEGFNYEFDAVMDDIRAGRLENELVTHAYTERVMRILCDVRAKAGLIYPCDK